MDPLLEGSLDRVTSYTPPPADSILTFLQKMEMTINNRMRNLEITISDRIRDIKDSLQEAHNKLYMILERQYEGHLLYHYKISRHKTVD